MDNDDLNYDELPNDGDDENLDDGLDGEHGDDVPSDDDNHDENLDDGLDSDDDNQDKSPKQPSISRDYIAELIRKQAETEQQAQTQKTPLEKPKIDDFTDWGEYQEKLDEYNHQRMVDAVYERIKADQQQQASIQQQAETIAVLDELSSEGVDMGAVMAKAEQLPPLPVTLDKFGLSTKETMLFAKDFVENTELYYELAQLNPYQFSARIGAMIEQRKSQSSQNNTPKPKQSKAPPPIKPVKANGTAKKNPYETSDDDFLKARGLV